MATDPDGNRYVIVDGVWYPEKDAPAKSGTGDLSDMN